MSASTNDIQILAQVQLRTQCVRNRINAIELPTLLQLPDTKPGADGLEEITGREKAFLSFRDILLILLYIDQL